jgi:hypothetical protein
MLGVSPEMLSIAAVLILSAVAAGTFAARFFIAASRTRTHGGQGRSDEEI